MLRLNELKPDSGAKKLPKRLGRGRGSGHGKTSCRGQKGQKSRSGGGIRLGFEGGQMPLSRRLPKRGFHNPFKKIFSIVNIRDLLKFEEGKVVDREALMDANIINKVQDGIKILGEGKIDRPLIIKVDKISINARKKIELAGGRVEDN